MATTRWGNQPKEFKRHGQATQRPAAALWRGGVLVLNVDSVDGGPIKGLFQNNPSDKTGIQFVWKRILIWNDVEASNN